MPILKATLDTNVFPAQTLIERARLARVDATAISVSTREVEGSSLEAELTALEKVLEGAVFDESRFDEAVFGKEDDDLNLEKALALISSGAFPPKGERENLTPGQRRQLRDAMILCAHVRACRDILVSNDHRAFINAGRREALESAFATRIMTVAEFEEFIESAHR